jgi:hypothetical protein
MPRQLQQRLAGALIVVPRGQSLPSTSDLISIKFTVSRILQAALRRLKISFINENPGEPNKGT